MSKQIKEVRIEINTKGAIDAEKAIDGINYALQDVQESAKELGTFLRGPTESLKSLNIAAGSLTESFKTAATSAGTLTTALNGNTVRATKGLSGYLDNLDLLTMSLKTVAEESTNVARNLERIDGSIQGTKTEAYLEEMLDSLSAVVLELQELNVGSRITTGRLKETRDSMNDLGATADRTEEELQAIAAASKAAGAGLGGASTGATNLDNRLKNFNKGTGSSTARNFSKMAFDTNYLTLLYAKLAINIYAVTESFRFLGEAANLDRLVQSTASFSAGVSGLNIPKLAKEMNEFSGSILSVADSMAFATKGAAFEFTADQLVRLSEGARKASIALGVNFTDAMDRVLRGISKQEIELFDELGIVTRLTPAFKAYAESVGKTIDQLSDYERQLALTNEVQKQLDDRFASIEANATPYEKLAKSAKDYTNSLLVTVSTGLGPFVELLAEALDISDPLADSTLELGQAMETVTSAARGDSLGILVTSYSELSRSIKEATKAANEVPAPMSRVEQVMSGMTTLFATLTGLLVASALAMGHAAGGASLFSGALSVLGGAATFAANGVRALTVAMAANPLTAAFVVLVGVATAAWAAYSNEVDKAADAETKKAASQSKVEDALILQAALEADLAAKGLKLEEVKYQGRLAYREKQIALEKEYNAKQLKFRGRALTDLEKKEQEHNFKVFQARKRTLGDYSAAEDKAVADAAARYKASEKAIIAGRSAASVLAQKSSLGNSSATDAIDAVRKITDIAKNSDGSVIKDLTEKRDAAFQDLQSDFIVQGLLAWDAEADSADKLLDLLENVHSAMIGISETRAKSVSVSAKLGEDSVESLERQLAVQKEYTAVIQSSGGFNAGEAKAERLKLEAMERQLDILEAQKEVAEEILALNRGYAVEQAKSSGYSVQNSVLLEREKANKLAILDAQIAQEGLGTAQIGRLMAERSHEERILDIKIAQAKAAEDHLDAMRLISAETAAQTRQRTSEDAVRDALGVSKTAVQSNSEQTSDLQQTKKAQTAELGRLEQTQTGADGITSTVGTPDEIFAVKQAILDTNSALETTGLLLGTAKVEDFSAKMGRLKAGLEGWELTGLQDTFLTTFDGLTSAIGMLGESFKMFKLETGDTSFLGPISFGFDSLFTAMTEGTENMGLEQIAAMENTIAAMSSIGQMGLGIFEELSAGKVAGYDAEIAAEKAKDGASEASLAKIKKLEAKKIKEETKTKKASVIMSTAMAIMQGYAQLGPIAGSFAAAAMGIMGALQLSNIDKAASGQMAALEGGGAPSSMSITGGTRDNSSDVSKAANAGELAFMSGAAGNGTANNFTPSGRAGGGFSPAGTAIMVGEVGPELITPSVPVEVTSAGNVGSAGSGITFAPVFNAQAVDANGMEALFQNYSRELYDGLQRELAANNRTLESL